ncbi:lycopene cyclase domain-containing protein [Natrinema soli]|uniref:Lycopene cyclase domain-containing protein n=1 Tax=Natrinema soli TaxID=1930624 RepID=A0ABD5SPP3_9EURY|nr:lycopene cyclase domain-containing protein [Natrinema soli]
MRDITVFGRYTYLVTEIVWGLVAALLLRRANALRKAAVTIVALYPIAYVWDRYTLAVGVFDIKLRTGVDIAGIPLEEHLFMAVVPGLVVGMHETIFGDESDEATAPSKPSAHR